MNGPMKRTGSPGVFISYSSKDNIFVKALESALDAKNVHCWIFEEDEENYQEWEKKIVPAISEVPGIIFVFSKHFIESPPCEIERRVVAHLDKNKKEKKFKYIGVMQIDETELGPEILSLVANRYGWHNQREPNAEELRQYADNVKKLLRESEAASPVSPISPISVTWLPDGTIATIHLKGAHAKRKAVRRWLLDDKGGSPWRYVRDEYLDRVVPKLNAICGGEVCPLP